MKILAFNGSPRGKRSNTDRILQPFLEGAREAGAETEVVYLKDKKINYCLGCFTCWTKTPGVCVHKKDDMPELLEKIRQADITVYATPLYIFTVTGLMKDFMDRHVPLVQPYIVKEGERYSHPPRYDGVSGRRAVLIANCGFPGRYNFAGLVETFRLFLSVGEGKMVATILRPMGELLGQPALQDALSWYFAAAHRAGREVVELGHITPETQAILDRELMPEEAFVTTANAWWNSQIAASKTGEGDDEPGQPLPPPTAPPTTLRETIAGMALVFNSQAAGDLEAVVQFDVSPSTGLRTSGEEPGQYYLRIAEGKCAAFEGVHPEPTLTIHTPSEVWLAISRGELDGAQAMMSGQYSVEGDLGLLIRFKELFGEASGASGKGG